MYTTHGDQHSGCGHSHATIAEAEACRQRYAARHALSDRVIWRVDGVRRLLLTREEALTAIRLHPNHASPVHS